MASSVVNFVRAGSGPPLVLIHGIGHRWAAWEPVIPRLAEHHDVFAIDLPGFGSSPVPAEGMPPDMPQTVARIADWLAEQGLSQPHVAGNSLGGAISLELAAAGLVASATALSPGGFFTDAERRRALGILKSMRYNTFIPGPVLRLGLHFPPIKALSFGALVVHPSRITAQRAYEDALALRRGKGFNAVARAAHDYVFSGLPADAPPVTVGWGAKDRIFGVHQLDRVRERLPSATCVALPGCGHVPMSDDPDAVADLILHTTGAR